MNLTRNGLAKMMTTDAILAEAQFHKLRSVQYAIDGLITLVSNELYICHMNKS